MCQVRQEARRALMCRQGLHGLFVLFEALWGEAEANLAPSDRVRSGSELADLVGLSQDHLRRSLRVLGSLGLVLPQRVNTRMAYDCIYVRTRSDPAVTALLERLRDGLIRPDFARGVVVGQGGQLVQAAFSGMSLQGDQEVDSGVEELDSQLVLENFSDTTPISTHSPNRMDLRAKNGKKGPKFRSDTGPITRQIVPGVYFADENGLAHAAYNNRSVSNIYKLPFVDVTKAFVTVSSNTPSNTSITSDATPADVAGLSGQLVDGDPIQLSQGQLEQLLDQAAQRAVGKTKKPRKSSDGWTGLTPEQQAEGDRIHATWQKLWKTDWSLTPKRKGIIAARLREGRTEADFEAVNRALCTVPFYLGQNNRQQPYFDFDNLFGSPEKFDRNLLKARRGNNGPMQPPRDSASTGRRF